MKLSANHNWNNGTELKIRIFSENNDMVLLNPINVEFEKANSIYCAMPNCMCTSWFSLMINNMTGILHQVYSMM